MAGHATDVFVAPFVGIVLGSSKHMHSQLAQLITMALGIPSWDTNLLHVVVTRACILSGNLWSLVTVNASVYSGTVVPAAQW